MSFYFYYGSVDNFTKNMVTSPDDSFKDSGVSVSEDLHTNLSQEDVKAILAAQDQFTQIVQKACPVRAGSRVYTYPVEPETPIETTMAIFDKQLKGTVDYPGFPSQFTKDHIEDSRSSYIRVSFPGKEPICVHDQKEAGELVQASRDFATSISSSKSLQAQEKLARVVMLSTSQILPNFLCDKAVFDQQVKRAESGNIGNEFKTKVRDVLIKITPVNGWFSQKEGEFNIEIKADVSTAHKALFAEGITPVERSAREALGVKPIIKTSVDASMVCQQDAEGNYSYNNMRVISSVQVNDIISI